MSTTDVSPSPPSTAPSHPVVSAERSREVIQTCTIRRSARDVYEFWRHVNNFVGIVPHPVAITEISATESHWQVTGPRPVKVVEWHAVIITDEPGELIAWRSREGADVPNAGSVRFRPAPGDEGTEVVVELRYEPPAGRVGAWIAKLTGKEPAQQLSGMLRRLKALLEAGEIPTIAGQPMGRTQRESEASERRRAS